MAALTPYHEFRKAKGTLIKETRNKYICKILRTIPEDEWLQNVHQVKVVGDAYCRGFVRAVNLLEQFIPGYDVRHSGIKGR